MIKKSEYLTDSTACGLRVTIQSTLDLCKYLNSCWNFKYLLTAKINQDKLEVSTFIITVDDESPLTPVITISDLKDIYNPEKSHLVEDLKNKLNKIITEKEWEFSDVVEHNYSKAEVKDCLIYYLTGMYNK